MESASPLRPGPTPITPAELKSAAWSLASRLLRLPHDVRVAEMAHMRQVNPVLASLVANDMNEISDHAPGNP